ncbi:MAG TPA: hypothetical protein VFP50_07405 [Anaeromyxobacteraceae bacterium]|nr:hypothetical protein [Anaeromyxobacteraceae bacterium]
MTARLGEILVSERACSYGDVREALQNQAIFGGRLGTNLLELGAVTEAALAHALGTRTGAPPLFGDLPPDPAALRLLDARLADRWDVVPYHVAERRLAILTRDPADLRMLDEVAFATSRHVHPFVVPEARLWRTLRSAYGLDRQVRGFPGERIKAEEAPARRVATGPDLMDEAGFDALYGRVGLQAPPPPAPPPADDLPVEDLLEPIEPEPPPLSPAVLDGLMRAHGHAPPAALPAGAALPPPVLARAPAPEPSPLAFAEALRFLEGVGERGAIARTVLRYARSKFRRAVLLTVRQGEAHGWAGLGAGLTDEAVHRIRLTLATPGVVATVVSSSAPYVGPLPKTWANVRLLKDLGGGVPKSALLLPVLALGRVVNVLYADNGRGEQVNAGDLGDLLILGTRIAQSYEVLVRRAV